MWMDTRPDYRLPGTYPAALHGVGQTISAVDSTRDDFQCKYPRKRL
jgi:hypothetical protein